MMLAFFASCNDIEIYSPPGPAGMSAYEVWVQAVEQGDVKWESGTDLPNYFKYIKGDKGDAGESAYALWIEYIKTGTVEDPHNQGSNWDPNKNTMPDFYYFLSGSKGEDGITPTINDKGNWQIGDIDTGIPAKGKDGQDGKDGSTISIGGNGNWIIDGVDTGIPAKGQDGKDGKDGSIVTIGDNGNWIIDGVDTGISAKGQDGKDGSTITIGDNGNWFVDGADTGIPAKGKDGQDGSDGKDGSVVTIGDNGNWFIDGTDTNIPAQGKDGQNGKDGSTVSIGDNGNWVIDGIDTGISAKGKDGQDGTDGKDGSSVIIGDNGNWVIDGVDTGVPAKGQDGKDGTSITIGDNGNWIVDGTDTGIPAKGKDGENGTDGKDGSTASIGDNGNWFIDGVDTGIPAKGQDGQDGKDGSYVKIYEGYWYIDGENTGIPARGQDGLDGSNGNDGKSAYEIWKQEVEAGKIVDKNGNPWPTTDITLQNFWEYLSGKDGQDAGEKQRTPLSFVSSTQNGANETFVFKTDAGATVTMNYRDVTISGVADGSGLCTLNFPNSQTEELPVVVYAESANKKESYPLSVKVRIDDRVGISYTFSGVKWYDSDDNLLDNSTGVHGSFIDGEVPYYSFEKAVSGTYITIPFEAAGIKNITFGQSGGFSQLVISAELEVANDYSKGVIKIKHNGGVWMAGTIEVTLTAQSFDDSIFTHKINVEPLQY